MCCCQFCLPVLTNVFSGVRNPWLETCAYSCWGPESFSLFQVSQRTREHPHKKREKKTPPVPLQEQKRSLFCCLSPAHSQGWPCVEVWRPDLSSRDSCHPRMDTERNRSLSIPSPAWLFRADSGKEERSPGLNLN